jgi:hypothetical protein
MILVAVIIARISPISIELKLFASRKIGKKGIIKPKIAKYQK